MLLRQGDRGDAVKVLQRDLNKLGAMLVVDGDFGAGTRNGVALARETLQRPGPPEADDELQQAVAAAPDPCPPLTAAGMTFIAREEVSDATTYQRRFQTPVWPTPQSGITIGIGYDLQFVNRAGLTDDWGDVLSAGDIDRLAGVLQQAGTEALLASVAPVVIPLSLAMRVFATRSLPKYLAQTRGIYPAVEGPALTPAQRTALVSLVYNRGTRLDGDRRREMQAIRDLLAAGRINDVAEQFESMTRLWNEHTEGGLIRRRRAEATLWRAGFAPLMLH
jgi:peptidoglycan hydrolase-like protein with peptidoglycan-binding domain